MARKERRSTAFCRVQTISSTSCTLADPKTLNFRKEAARRSIWARNRLRVGRTESGYVALCAIVTPKPLANGDRIAKINSGHQQKPLSSCLTRHVLCSKCYIRYLRKACQKACPYLLTGARHTSPPRCTDSVPFSAQESIRGRSLSLEVKAEISDLT